MQLWTIRRIPALALTAALAMGAPAMAQQPADTEAGPTAQAPSPPSTAAAPSPEAPPEAAAPSPEAAPTVDLPPAAANPGWLGVGLENIEGDAARTLGFEFPVPRVKLTFRGSPAETIGMLRGDLVLEVGDAKLQGGMKEMIARVKSNPIDTEIRLLVRRDGQDLELKAKLGTIPDRKAMVESEWLGRPLPSLPLLDLTTHRKVDLTALRGKVIVIDAWATWCGPCKRAMPLLEELQKQYALKGLQVVGASDEERPVLEAFVRNRPVGYQILHDAEASLAGTLYVSSLPTFFVIDRKGVIRTIKYGTQGAQELEAVVKPLLDEE